MAPELFDPCKPPSLELVDRTDCWCGLNCMCERHVGMPCAGRPCDPARPCCLTVAPPTQYLPQTTTHLRRAIGAMAFQLLTGEPPYSHDVPACLARLVLEEPVPLRMLRLMCASPPAVEFIYAALEKDPAQRPTAAALRGHPWLVQHARLVGP